jgi:hypothetical protein
MWMVFVAGALLGVSACTSNDPEAGTRSTSTTEKRETLEQRADRMAADLGCAPTRRASQLGGDTWSVDCTIDGRVSTRLIVFDAGQRGRVERSFDDVAVYGNGTSCLDGLPVNQHRYLIGDDWFVITAERAVGDRLLERDDAEVMAEGGGDLFPPVSYAMPDLCARAPADP